MARVVTAVVLIPLVLLVVLRADNWLFALLLAGLALLALRELYALAAFWNIRPYTTIGRVSAFLLVLAFAFSGQTQEVGPILVRLDVPLVLTGAVVAVLLRALSHAERLRESLHETAVTLFGLVYPVLLLALLADVRGYARGDWWIVFMLVVVWIGDTAAYYVGRNLGRHLLAPRVSPKKTWEGAIGSTIAAIVFGGLMGQFAPELTSALVRVHLASAPVASRAPFWQTALLAFPMTVAAQLGDLVESVFKRGAGVKDSGALLPGHGGVLDRIDAMLLAIPVLWYYLTLRA